MPEPVPDTTSQDFIRFFQGSQVVDESGAPMLVYHSGTFDPREGRAPAVGKAGMHWGSLEAARERIWGKIHDDFVNEASYEQDADTGRWFWDAGGISSWDFDPEGFESEERAREDADAHAVAEADSAMEGGWEGFPITSAWLSIKNPKVVPDAGAKWSAVIRQAKKEGHDGLVYRNLFEDKGSLSWVVFHPDQILVAGVVEEDRP